MDAYQTLFYFSELSLEVRIVRKLSIHYTLAPILKSGTKQKCFVNLNAAPVLSYNKLSEN
jgi:hypothetical protein